MGFGSTLGGLLGSLGSAFLPIPGVNGQQLGSALGGMLGFKRGGVVGQKVVPSTKVYARGGMVAPTRAYQRGGKVKKSKK